MRCATLPDISTSLFSCSVLHSLNTFTNGCCHSAANQTVFGGPTGWMGLNERPQTCPVGDIRYWRVDSKRTSTFHFRPCNVPSQVQDAIDDSFRSSHVDRCRQLHVSRGSTTCRSWSIKSAQRHCRSATKSGTEHASNNIHHRSDQLTFTYSSAVCTSTSGSEVTYADE